MISPLALQACTLTWSLHSTFPQTPQLFTMSYDLVWPNMGPTWSNALWYMFYISKPLQHASYLNTLHCTCSAATSIPQMPLGTFNMPPTCCTNTCWTHTLCLHAVCSLFGLCAVPSWSRRYWNNKESLALWYIGLCMFYFTSFLIYFNRFCSLSLALCFRHVCLIAYFLFRNFLFLTYILCTIYQFKQEIVCLVIACISSDLGIKVFVIVVMITISILGLSAFSTSHTPSPFTSDILHTCFNGIPKLFSYYDHQCFTNQYYDSRLVSCINYSS
jgi:hypothetical protein